MFTYEEVKAMTKPLEFAKQFKKMIHWRKAKGIIILADYKMGTKKMTIAIPYKKSNDAKKIFKDSIKGDSFPGLPPKRKIFVGQMKIEKQADGTEKVIVKQIEGGATAELINEKAGGLFQNIKIGFEVQDPNATETTEAPETTPEAPTTPTSEPTDATENTSGGDIRALAQAAKTAMQLVKDQLVPAFRAGNITASNSPQLNEAKTKLVNFKTAYEAAAANVKAQLERLYQPLERMLMAIDKMLEQASSNTSTESTTPSENTNSNGRDLANMIRSIKTAMQEVKATAVANLRAQKVTDNDLKMVEVVIAQINEFNTQYAQAAAPIQQQLAQHKDKVQTMLTQLQGVATKIKDALAASSGTGSSTERIQQNQERLEQIRSRISEIRETLAA